MSSQLPTLCGSRAERDRDVSRSRRRVRSPRTKGLFGYDQLDLRTVAETNYGVARSLPASAATSSRAGYESSSPENRPASYGAPPDPQSVLSGGASATISSSS